MNVVAADEFCAPVPFSAPPFLHQPGRCLDLSPEAPHVLVGCPLLPTGNAGSLAFHTTGPDHGVEEPRLAGEQGEMVQRTTSVQSTC